MTTAQNKDTRTGVTLPVRAKHAGHTVTVEKRDIAKHKAYWLRCSCGERALMGEYWLDRAMARGSVGHDVIAGRDD